MKGGESLEDQAFRDLLVRNDVFDGNVHESGPKVLKTLLQNNDGELKIPVPSIEQISAESERVLSSPLSPKQVFDILIKPEDANGFNK